MGKRLNKIKKSRVKNLSPNYTLRAPPYDIYSAFQPWGYTNLYHHCEEAKMKRSYDWVYSAFKAEEENIKIMDNKIQEEMPPIKIHIKERVLRVEIGVGGNKKVLYIDLKEYLSIAE